MKQVLLRKGMVSVEDVPAPMLKPGHVLVEVAYSLVSPGTEVASIKESKRSLVRRAIDRPDQVKKLVDHLRSKGVRKTVALVQGHLDTPIKTGYSCSGFVIQVGEGVTDISPGDSVACAGSGYANHAEIVVVPRNLVVKIPRGCTLRDASSVTLGAIAIQGVRRADVRLGERVAVIGLGILGLLTTQLLKAAGCQVIAADLDERRVKLAQNFGADRVITTSDNDWENPVHQFTGGYGVDATIITAGSTSDAIVQQAMEITRKKGKVVVVGGVGLGLKRSPFYEKEIDFLMSSSYGPGRYDVTYEERGEDYPFAYVRWTENRNMEEYLRLIAEGKVQLKSVVEYECDISEVRSGFDKLQTDSDRPIAVLIHYPINQAGGPKMKLGTRTMLRVRPVKGKVRIAVVGAGSFARDTHLPNLRQLSSEFHLRAIVSATGSSAKASAQHFGADYASTSYSDILGDPEVDAVLIATRHHLHGQQVIDALHAGKNVYCEKPLVLMDQELDKILAFYGLSEVDLLDGCTIEPGNDLPVLMTGFNRRFAPAALCLKEIVSRRVNPLMALYRVNATKLPPDNWVHGPEGGGRLVGDGCHMLDFFQFLVGTSAVRLSVERLSSLSTKVLSGDNATVSVGYQDGSVCTLIYTSLGSDQTSKEYVEVFVDGQSLILDDFKSLRYMPGGKIAWSSTQPDKGHIASLRRFYASVKGEEPWPMTLAEQVSVSRVVINMQSMTR